MRWVLRSSAIELLMLVLFIARGAIFSASLLSPGMGSLADHAIDRNGVIVETHNA
jgi:hypothetical protein